MPATDGARTLLKGTFEIPATYQFGKPGHHEVLTAELLAPQNLGATAGSRLVVNLWDDTRPEMTCWFEHPSSGCLTVDWADES